MDYRGANIGKPSNESVRASHKNAPIRPPRTNISNVSTTLTSSIGNKHEGFRRQIEEIEFKDVFEDIVAVEEFEDSKDQLIQSQVETIHELRKKLNEMQKIRLSVLNENSKRIAELENELKQCQQERDDFKKQLDDRSELDYGNRRESSGTKSGAAASRVRATQNPSSFTPSLAIQEAQPKETPPPPPPPLPSRPLRNIDNKINSKFWECLSKTHSQWSMNELAIIPSLPQPGNMNQTPSPTVFITGPNGTSYTSLNELIEAAATALTYSIVRNECKKMSAVIEKAAAKNNSNSKLGNTERKSHVGGGGGGGTSSSAKSARSSTGNMTINDDDDDDDDINDEDYLLDNEQHETLSVSVKERSNNNNSHANNNNRNTNVNKTKNIRQKTVIHNTSTTTTSPSSTQVVRPLPITNIESDSEGDLQEDEVTDDNDDNSDQGGGQTADEKRLHRMCENLKAWIRHKKKFKIEDLNSAHSHLDQELVRRAFSKLEREDFVYVDLSGTRNPHYKISEAELPTALPPSTQKSKKRSNQSKDHQLNDNLKKRS